MSISPTELQMLVNQPSYNTTSNHRQQYSKKDVIAYPERDFDERSTFSKVMGLLFYLAVAAATFAAIRKWSPIKDVTILNKDFKDCETIGAKIKYATAVVGEWCLKPFKYVADFFKAKQTESQGTPKTEQKV